MTTLAIRQQVSIKKEGNALFCVHHISVSLCQSMEFYCLCLQSINPCDKVLSIVRVISGIYDRVISGDQLQYQTDSS